MADELPTTNVCIVVDVHLPEMNGAELWEALANSGCVLPVIFITGRRDPATKAVAERVPAVAFLFKPFDENLLLQAISQALHA